MDSKWPQLADTRCLVTGGTTGIGRAIVQLLYDNGARVVTCGRRQQQLDTLLIDLDRPTRVTAIKADVSDKNDLDMLFESVSRDLGGLDLLVANAAIAGESVYDTKEADIEEILRINLFGQIACVKRALELLPTGGRVVLVGSMSADVREEEGNVYVASKAGLQGFAGAFRKAANKKGVHVHLVEPGAVATPLHGISNAELAHKLDKQEMLEASEIADCVAFVVTRSSACDIVGMQVRPHKQFI